MSDLTLSKTRFQDGLWEGVLTGATGAAGGDPPALTAHASGYSGAPEVDVDPDGTGQWRVRVTVPRAALCDGHQVFRVCAEDGGTLARFEVLAGDALEDDLRAEVAALRAEVDLLTSALRRVARRQDGRG